MNSISVQVLYCDFSHMIYFLFDYWFVTLTQTDRAFPFCVVETFRAFNIRVLHYFLVLIHKVQRPPSGVA